VKLQPTPEQAYALLRTLETANKACDRLSELAWEAQEFGQYSLHKAFHRTIRDEFPLSAQVVVRLNAKVADAYKIDQKVQRQFRTHGSISYDLRNVNRPNVAGVDVSGVHSVAKRSLVTSCLL